MSEVAQGNEDIYRDHILPTIHAAKKGDELMFVTPSCFFGFYSVGAKTYDQVCGALKQAKNKGVKCKIIIDVGDLFTAVATQGLLKFLREDGELRHFPNISTTYFLLICHEGGKSEYLDFYSYPETFMEFLPDVRVRRFGPPTRGAKTLEGIETSTIRARFETLWNQSNTHVKDTVNSYLPSSYLKRRFDYMQLLSLFGYFLIGVLFGVFVTLSSNASLQLPISELVVYALGSLSLGILANFITGWVGRRWFGR